MDTALILIPLGAGLILVSDLIGNLISFKHRLYNAVTTAIVWCVLFVALNLIYESLELTPPHLVPSGLLVKWTAAGIVFAFAADLVGNHIAFDNRIVNSIITAIVWSVLFFVFLMIVGW
jgi:ABC-type enterochelin transport system permease subunit